MPPKSKRIKIECRECHKELDSDQRIKHNKIFNKNLLRRRKQIKFKVVGASDAPFFKVSYNLFLVSDLYRTCMRCIPCTALDGNDYYRLLLRFKQLTSAHP